MTSGPRCATRKQSAAARRRTPSAMPNSAQIPHITTATDKIRHRRRYKVYHYLVARFFYLSVCRHTVMFYVILNTRQRNFTYTVSRACANIDRFGHLYYSWQRCWWYTTVAFQLPISKLHTAHFEITHCTLRNSKLRTAHFEITHCTLPNSKLHTAHFEITHCTLPNSKLRTAHFEITHCTLPNSKLHTSNFRIAHF